MYLVICIAYSTKSHQHRRGSTGFAKTRATPKSGGVKTNFPSMAIGGDLIHFSVTTKAICSSSTKVPGRHSCLYVCRRWGHDPWEFCFHCWHAMYSLVWANIWKSQDIFARAPAVSKDSCLWGDARTWQGRACTTALRWFQKRAASGHSKSEVASVAKSHWAHGECPTWPFTCHHIDDLPVATWSDVASATKRMASDSAETEGRRCPFGTTW